MVVTGLALRELRQAAEGETLSAEIPEVFKILSKSPLIVGFSASGVYLML